MPHDCKESHTMTVYSHPQLYTVQCREGQPHGPQGREPDESAAWSVGTGARCVSGRAMLSI